MSTAFPWDRLAQLLELLSVNTLTKKDSIGQSTSRLRSQQAVWHVSQTVGGRYIDATRRRALLDASVVRYV